MSNQVNESGSEFPVRTTNTNLAIPALLTSFGMLGSGFLFGRAQFDGLSISQLTLNHLEALVFFEIPLFLLCVFVWDIPNETGQKRDGDNLALFSIPATLFALNSVLMVYLFLVLFKVITPLL